MRLSYLKIIRKNRFQNVRIHFLFRKQGMANSTILADRVAVSRIMFIIMAAETAIEVSMPDMIRVGQTYRMKLELGESKVAILIPRGGFFQSTGGQWIFVVDESNEFAEKREIRIGRQNNEFYEVLSGLTPSERVIVSNYDNYGDVDKLVFK